MTSVPQCFILCRVFLQRLRWCLRAFLKRRASVNLVTVVCMCFRDQFIYMLSPVKHWYRSKLRVLCRAQSGNQTCITGALPSQANAVFCAKRETSCGARCYVTCNCLVRKRQCMHLNQYYSEHFAKNYTSISAGKKTSVRFDIAVSVHESCDYMNSYDRSFFFCGFLFGFKGREGECVRTVHYSYRGGLGAAPPQWQ